MIATSEKKNPVTITESDLKVLRQFVTQQSEHNEMSLAYELKRAKIIKDEEAPSHIIRLGSQVKVKELQSGRELSFKIVMPAEANMSAQKISILTPMGTALIGIEEGAIVEWKMPAGVRQFEILEVR